MKTLRSLLGVVTLMQLAACTQPSTAPRPTPSETVGTVLYFDLEGGFYAIRGDDHATYDPVNLPTDFQRNGLRVIATLRPLSGVYSFHQVGTIVEVVAIRPL